jgi:hypothetical protein
MQSSGTSQENRAHHVAALAAGVLSLAAVFTIQGGVGEYLALVAIGATAVILGHRAILRRGALQRLAIIGLVFSYLELLAAVGLLLLRVTGWSQSGST